MKLSGAELRSRAIAAGKCATCRVHPARPGKKICHSCAEAFKAYKIKNRTKIKEYRSEAVERRKRIITEAKRVPCMDCGGTFHPVCMDFDHRDRSKKFAAVSRLKYFSNEAVLREIAKCDVVCANCHRLRTHLNQDHLPLSDVDARSTQTDLVFNKDAGEGD